MHEGTVSDPGKFYNEYLLMKELGWSYQQIVDTPNPVLEEVILRITFENKFRKKKKEIEDSINNSSSNNNSNK